LNAI
jgi:hypothetical protein